MDEIVRQALAKWPNVPHCTGWLLLDQRGVWRMRDEAAQAAGLPGTPIRHAALLGFIARNYLCDEHGQWFFQNGPQRVYVELAYTPWVVRLAHDGDRLALTDHANAVFEPASAWLDDAGNVLFVATEADGDTDAGANAGGAGAGAGAAHSPARVAVLHDHDLGLFADHADLERGEHGMLSWNDGRELPLRTIARDAVAARFGFVPSPATGAKGAGGATGTQHT